MSINPNTSTSTLTLNGQNFTKLMNANLLVIRNSSIAKSSQDLFQFSITL